MGRRKIEIELVKDPNTRQVTFSKRRTGLFKKANELSILCGAEVAIVVFSPGNKPYSFGHPGVDIVAETYLQQESQSSDSQEYSSFETPNVEKLEKLNQEFVEIMAQINEAEKEAKSHDQILKENDERNLVELKELRDSYIELQDSVKLRLSDLEISQYMMLLAQDPVVGVKAKSARKKRRNKN
ncbi:unnamed protein product [Lathyrus oleraceus]|uniref:agamous-like MADS-box protein AGL29 n=1 Tax=Pisum sativum TaxID=3888 RepID=UPI001FC490E3|nr:agamous-like MADS-box protein AGL29 [Pisum sativum]